MVYLVSSTMALRFAPSTVKGLLGHIAGFDWYENERLWSRLNGDDVTANTDADADVTDGGNTMDMSDDMGTTTVGSVFTVAGVYACHAETKASLGYLQQYVILTGTDGEVTVSPNTNLTGATQNVCSAAGAALGDCLIQRHR